MEEPEYVIIYIYTLSLSLSLSLWYIDLKCRDKTSTFLLPVMQCRSWRYYEKWAPDILMLIRNGHMNE